MIVLLITTTDHKATLGSLGDHPRWNVPLFHTSTQPLGTTNLYCFYKALPHVITGTDKHWGKKALEQAAQIAP